MKGGKRGFVGKGKGARTGQESIVNSPYMPRLLKEILAWDYLDLLLKDRARSGPRKVKTDFHLDFQKRLRKIPLKFPDADSFQDCFEALLLEVSERTRGHRNVDPAELAHARADCLVGLDVLVDNERRSFKVELAKNDARDLAVHGPDL